MSDQEIYHKENISQRPEQTGFVLGVWDHYDVRDSGEPANAVVTGVVSGTVHVGDAVYVSNFGDDEEGRILVTTVLWIEAALKGVDSATDCSVHLCIEKGAMAGIKCGTVLFTRNITTKQMHDAYITAIDKGWPKEDPTLDSFLFRVYSVTDYRERLQLIFQRDAQAKNRSEAEERADSEKIEHMAMLTCNRMLTVKSMYCVYSKATGEPYLFSSTELKPDGTPRCSPPNIMLLTKAYKDFLSVRYPEDQFEIREIPCGENGKDLQDFLSDAGYRNGACFYMINYTQIPFRIERMVSPPDVSNVPENGRPVMNPKIERWLLSMAQMGHPDTPDEKVSYKLYTGLMLRELSQAELLVPVKHQGDIPAGGESGKTVPEQNVSRSFATVPGKGNRPAVRMYTDWKRLYAEMGEGWDGIIRSVNSMINAFDCVINLTDGSTSGYYLSKETFDAIPSITSGN